MPNTVAPYFAPTPSYNGFNQQPQSFNSIPKVTGFEGAKAYQMGANQCVALGSVSQTYAATAGEPVNFTVTGLIRNACCDGRSFVEFVLSTGSGTVSQSNVIVTKI